MGIKKSIIAIPVVLTTLMAVIIGFVAMALLLDRSSIVGQNLGSCSVPGVLPESVPEPLSGLILEAAAEWGTDPLALAVIFHNENGWRYDRELPPPYGNGIPWPTSSAGAQGPMQFMPGTWAGYRNSNPINQPGNVWDLKDALYGAAHYLSDLGAKAGTPLGSPETVTQKGTVLNAIVSYHSGSANNLGPRGREYMAEGYEAYQKLQAKGGLTEDSSLAIEVTGDCSPTVLGGGAVATEWQLPLDKGSYWVSSLWGSSRGVATHNGIDLAAPEYTPIYAAASGTITVAEFGYRKIATHYNSGNVVVINHNDGTGTIYAHMIAFAKGIIPGVDVQKGQVIGYVGNTGYSQGNHLHFGTEVNVSPDGKQFTQVDPVGFMSARGLAF